MDTRKISIFDTTLRDGEQSPGCSMKLHDKLLVAGNLEALKVDVIEAGFAIASPGDFESVQAIAAHVKDCTVASLARCLKGDIDQAWAAVKSAARPRIHVFLATSPVHMQYKLRMTPEQVLQQATSMVAYARNLCPEVQFSLEDYTRTEEEFSWQVIESVIKAGAVVKHYIISSGIKEMIEGTAIAGEFDKIFASTFMYDLYGVAHWPAQAINYTTKMQFLFRINKGILDINRDINSFMPEDERPVPFRRMVYFGDGSTDIPAMKLVRTQGGYSIAVHGPGVKRPESLLSENRVNYVAEADYREGSDLTAQVKRVIAKICAERAVETEGE